ncbi:MAG: DUF1080 domain-containing protein [Opitutae bacterium]|nr:DUF1080 domain-containing protein [Opitutae bacterium]
MNRLNAFGLGLFALLAVLVSAGQAAPAEPKLAVQAYTYRSFTYAEALEKAQAAGIRYMQIYPNQTIGAGLTTKTHFTMDEATRAKVLELAKARGITLISYGVVNGKDEAEWRQIFAFAKAMGIGDIASEPKVEVLPLVDQLSKESGVTVSIHNHPKPSIYFDPTFALATIKDFGPNIGLCADTGHWARSGFDPVASLRQAQGRILTLHFKDLNERGVKTAHDVPWGTGVSDVADQIVELRRQGFAGYLIMEYEHNTPALQSDVQRSVEYFRRALAAPTVELARHAVVPPEFSADVSATWADKRGKDSKRWAMPQPVFAPDLSNAELKPGSWVWEKDVLVAKGGGDIWTKESFGDFALSLEFRCQEKTNSGVFLRCSDPAEWLHTAIEVQILQGDAENDKHIAGAIFDCLAPTRQIEIKPGVWYRYVIVAKGSKLNVFLDGENIVKADLNKWTEAHKNPDGTPNKFNTAYKDMARAGRIGLQYHGTPIEFRNILVERR